MTADRQPPPHGPASADRRSVVLYTTLTALVAAVTTPTLLVGLGLAGMVVDGVRGLPLVLLVTGVAAGAWAAVALPRRVLVDTDGIRRDCLLRQHRLAWAQVAAIERGPGPRRTRTRPPTRHERPEVGGGLLARGHGRRRWMLTDRVESPREFDALVAIVEDAAADTDVEAPRPHPHAPPTDLYRRRRRG